MRTRYNLPIKTIIVQLVLFSTIGILVSAFGYNKENINDDDEYDAAAKDSVASVTAFMDVYKVLMSPRCMNCHPAGDIPLQGDDSHLHAMYPRRGKDGKGLYAMKCGNCHQPTPVPGVHIPPANANWHLPPADMKMVFQGRTANQLAKQLIDPKQNGHKNKQQLLEHAHDALVLTGWHMGGGRTQPPLTHGQFVKAWTTWIEKGAYAPQP